MSWLHTTPLLVICAAALIALLAALELGHRLARVVPVSGQQAAALASPILALVSLLLAFAFSIANERHGDRRIAAVQGANSIGTFWLRTSLVPEPTRSEMRARVDEYVDVHIDHRLAGSESARTAELEAKAQRLQGELWTLVSAEANREPDSHRVLLVTPALNAMIDDSATVVAAWEHRVPDAIVVYLALLALVAGAVLGYRPVNEARNWVLWCAFSLVVAGVLTALIDLNRPRGGLMQTDIAPYIRLRDTMQGR